MSTPFLSPLSSFAQKPPLKNWAGNFTYSTTNISYPNSVEEIKTLVKKGGKLKMLGSRHCFNRIADSKVQLISTKNLNKIISINSKASTVTIEGGMNYGQLCPLLQEKGFALHNLASLPHISVAGAITTATHGSGVKNGNLSTAVEALELMNADGDLVTLSKSKDPKKFYGAVVGLGAMGVITKVTLALQPAFEMRQRVFLRLPVVALKDHFDEIMSSGYSVSLFIDWQTEFVNEVWIKSRMDDKANDAVKPDFFGARAATHNVHPIVENSPENCTEQMGVAGHWYERLPHFKMGFTPSSGVELQSEYFIPRKDGYAAMMAVMKLGKLIGPHLFISEIRTIAADNFWMSPCHGQDSVTVHFTWKQEWDAVIKLLPLIEKALEPFGARPHWGKINTIPASRLKYLYPKMEEFKTLAAGFDPRGKFRNEFLEEHLYTV
ncbi:MAG: FAD-binding protein [Chitinophagaceae bacterium]